MRTWKVLIALIVATTPAACGSPDSDDGASLDTLVPPTEEVQDSPPPDPSTTSDAASGGPVQQTTTPVASSTGRPSSGGVTTTTRATGTGRTTTTTRGSATTQPDGTAAPSKQEQTISFAPPAGTWAYGERKSVTATASSELPVTFGATGACEVVDALLGTLVVTDVGECNVTASQDGDSGWNPAPPVTRSITISKATPVIEGFVGRPTEYPRHAFSIPLTAAANDGAIVKYRTLPDDFGVTFCTIAGADLQVPVTQGLPQTCVVEAYVEESRLFVAARKVERFEITPTVVEFTGHGIKAVTTEFVTVSVTLNREWRITADANCSTTYLSAEGKAEYELTFEVTEPAPGENPCAITAISVTIAQIDGAQTSEQQTLNINVPPP